MCPQHPARNRTCFQFRNQINHSYSCSHDLPPAVPPPKQQGAGVGPAFSEDDVNTGADVDEHPGSALERELGEHGLQ